MLVVSDPCIWLQKVCSTSNVDMMQTLGHAFVTGIKYIQSNCKEHMLPVQPASPAGTPISSKQHKHHQMGRGAHFHIPIPTVLDFKLAHGTLSNVTKAVKYYNINNECSPCYCCYKEERALIRSQRGNICPSLPCKLLPKSCSTSNGPPMPGTSITKYVCLCAKTLILITNLYICNY